MTRVDACVALIFFLFRIKGKVSSGDGGGGSSSIQAKWFRDVVRGLYILCDG